MADVMVPPIKMSLPVKVSIPDPPMSRSNPPPTAHGISGLPDLLRSDTGPFGLVWVIELSRRATSRASPCEETDHEFLENGDS